MPDDRRSDPTDLIFEDWTEIGKRCSAGRRSLWIRFVLRRSTDLLVPPNVVAIDLRAGRAGADASVRLTPDNPQFRELFELLSTARFAATT